MVAAPCSAVSVYIHGHVAVGRLASLLWHWTTLDSLLTPMLQAASDFQFFCCWIHCFNLCQYIQQIFVASLGLQYLATQALGSLLVLGLLLLDSINVAWIR
jgi:hypothetical protein